MKKLIKKIPVVGKVAVRLNRNLKGEKFESTEQYWENRYSSGGTSGVGSYDKFAEYKAEVINDFIEQNGVQTAMEMGCGDGNQLSYFKVNQYKGYEISHDAVRKCQERFKEDTSKSFAHFEQFQDEKFDLTLSLDVVYCVVEDAVFEQYMNRLFNSSKRFVIVYSTDTEKNPVVSDYIKHRKFSNFVAKKHPEFKLVKKLENKFQGEVKPFISDFYFFMKEE